MATSRVCKRVSCFSSLLFLARKTKSSYNCWDQLEYTTPTGFRFLGEPMFCFSTLNANTNPIPNPNPNLAANAVPAKPAWAPTLATNTVAKPAWAPTLAANTVAKPAWAPTLASRAIIMLSNPVIEILQVPYIPTNPNLDARSFNDPRDLHMTDTLNSKKNRYANLLSLMACPRTV